MAVNYTFGSLAELADHFRQQGEQLRKTAPDMRSKRRADVALIEASVLDNVVKVIDATKLE